MVSMFNIDDIVVFENEIYIVKSIHYIDYFVYGLVLLSEPTQVKQKIVKEGLLKVYTN